ncbi:MAG: class I SAM-dependent methyltransferase [Sphingomonas sp.]|nr:class I SAM-dependent methyltransferase [Sphingomonas sp.]
MKVSKNRDVAFTPALGRAELTGLYDLAVKFLTREHIWRAALLAQLAPHDGESIIDVGCGTGTFAILVKKAAPKARIVGLDPDPKALALAATKAAADGIDIEWRHGFARDTADAGAAFDKIVTSLMFHQVPLSEKRAGLEAMFGALRPDGELHVADYAHQSDQTMRRLFRLTVQCLDGLEDTQPNADGVLEDLMSELAENRVSPRTVVRTITGAISLFRIEK